jgi:hypothetical protein
MVFKIIKISKKFEVQEVEKCSKLGIAGWGVPAQAFVHSGKEKSRMVLAQHFCIVF